MTLIKSISGIRGTVGGEAGDNLTPSDIVRFTVGYSRWLLRQVSGRRPVVAVGRDARLSGEMVYSLVEGTLMGCGVDVIDLGLCTTPGVEMAVTAKAADGGIIITASHNPRQWNALKLLNARGEFLSDADEREVLRLADAPDFAYPDVDALGCVIERSSFGDEHIDRVLALPLVDAEAVRKRGFRVTVDAVNSVGGIVIPRLLERMGVEVERLNCEPTGDFAHNPEPIAANLSQVMEAVRRNGSDMGIVVDPDVDRLAFVCEDGELFGEEYTLVAVADYVLSATPGDTVSNLSSTRALRDVTERHGGHYAASAVGEVNVVAKMKETGAVIGGEGNGGVIYPALHYGRDALVGVALLLTSLARSGKRMTELRSGYPQYYMAKDKITLRPGMDVAKILSGMKDAYSGERITDTDGVKIDFPEGWVHMRSSNTEPIIRIYSESRDPEEARRLAARFAGEIERLAGAR